MRMLGAAVHLELGPELLTGERRLGKHPEDGLLDDPVRMLREKIARRRVPLRRYGEPEEVAHATLSLVLPAASYINGAVLVVDGGMTIQNT